MYLVCQLYEHYFRSVVITFEVEIISVSISSLQEKQVVISLLQGFIFWQILIIAFRLVDKINNSIGQDPNSKSIIGVLDIYGFESFKFNR